MKYNNEEYTISGGSMLTQDILIKHTDGGFDTNKYGEFWAVILRFIVSKQDNLILDQMYRVTIASSPFIIDRDGHKTQAEIHMFQGKARKWIEDNMDKVLLSPITKVPLHIELSFYD